MALSLLVGDIDHFKQVNDSWGHAAGDRVIATFGKLITTNVRGLDIAGRIGGEEFCILIWNCGEEGAVSLGNRLRAAFSKSKIAGVGDGENFTASFGVAQLHDGESYAQAFDRADKALYTAKRAGRDRVAAAPSRAMAKQGALDDAAVDDVAEGETEVENSAEAGGEVVPFAKAAAGKGRSAS